MVVLRKTDKHAFSDNEAAAAAEADVQLHDRLALARPTCSHAAAAAGGGGRGGGGRSGEGGGGDGTGRLWCSADVTIIRTTYIYTYMLVSSSRCRDMCSSQELRVLSHVRTPPAAAVSVCVRARQK